jgi:ribose/xylose/arabinose/galactoside ABC-type transport system permease subunit
MTVLSAETATKRQGINWSGWAQRLGALIGLVLVFSLFAVLRPRTFLSLDNLEQIILETAVVATAALGMTLIIISGGIDLSVGSNIAMCTVVVALLLHRGTNPILAAAGGVAVSACWGLIIGGLVTALDLAPFIVTLGLWGGIRGVAKGFASNSTVSAPDTWLNSLLTTLGPGQRWMVLPPGVWVTVVLAIAVAGLMRYTKFGRHLFAVGSNQQTARLCGVNVSRTKLGVYFIGAALAGVAGVLQFSYVTMGDPTTADGMELDIIAAVVIGGASLTGGEGTVLGTIVGALLMKVVNNGCAKLHLDNWVQQIVTGAIIITAAALDRLRHRRAT